MRFYSFDELYCERLRSGDFQTQQHFIIYFSELIRLKLGTRLRSLSAIEDVRQETFARVWVALRDEQCIRRPERLGAFVNSVCNNVLREHYRRDSKEVPIGNEVGINVPDPSISVDDAIDNAQTQKRVRHILTRLAERDRLLLAAVFLDERDKDEVCRTFGVNREYLRVLLYRARKSFRAMSSPDSEDSGGGASVRLTLPEPISAAQKPIRAPTDCETQIRTKQVRKQRINHPGRLLQWRWPQF